jgi:hypothetical protein
LNAYASANMGDDNFRETQREGVPMIQRRRKKAIKRGVNIVMTDSTAPPSAHIASHDIIQYITKPELP